MEDWILNQLLKEPKTITWKAGINDATPEEWDRVRSNTLLADVRDGFSWPYEKASNKQVGGDHYKGLSIQPAEFCHRNNIPYLEATAIKYLCRWRSKGGVQDLDKAIHFIELLKEYESLKGAKND